MLKFQRANPNRVRRFILGDSEDFDDQDDLDADDWNEEEPEPEIRPDLIQGGGFDYLNDDGIVVPKDTIF